MVISITSLFRFTVSIFFLGHGHGHNHGNRDAVASAEPKRLAHATIGDLESKHLMSSHQVPSDFDFVLNYFWRLRKILSYSFFQCLIFSIEVFYYFTPF